MDKEALILGYFENTLTPKQQSALHELLAADEGFKDEFAFQLELREAIKESERSDLKTRFNKLDSQHQHKSLNRRWYAIAAAIIVSLGLGWALFFFKANPDPQQLYATHFEPYPNVISPTVRDNSEPTADMEVVKAFRLYDNKQYTEAAAAFAKLYQSTGEDYARFYHSVSLMAEGHTKEATSILEKHIWEEPENYLTISYWYLGLGYLKQENHEKAAMYLKKVADSNKPFSQQARELLQELP